MKKLLFLSLFVYLVIGLFAYVPTFAFAQTPSDTTQTDPASGAVAGLGVARMVDTKEKNVKDGNILSSSPQGAVLTTIPYDSQILGIVSRNAGIMVSTTGDDNGIPVISDGTLYVLVSSQQGAIKKGDQITSSTIPGVGVKAIKSGYVLGSALEDYTNPDPKKTGLIAVSVNLHYFNSKPTFAGTLTDIFKIALLPTKDSPAPIFKYVVAALVVLGSLALGFISFGRTAAKGVEALGRNPAASGVIQLGIIFNVAIVVVIAAAGLVVAFLILRL